MFTEDKMKNQQQKIIKFETELSELLAKMLIGKKKKGPDISCNSCAEIFPEQMKKLTGPYCVDCYRETNFGIAPTSVIFQDEKRYAKGCSQTYTNIFDNEPNPSWENAVRALEEVE